MAEKQETPSDSQQVDMSEYYFDVAWGGDEAETQAAEAAAKAQLADGLAMAPGSESFRALVLQMREDEAHQIWVDALEKGVRTEEYLDGTTIKFREIMARPGGEEGDLLIRHGLETIMDDGTTRVTTTYLDPKDPGATVMVTSLRHDGLETITGLTGKSDLKLGDSRDIP